MGKTKLQLEGQEYLEDSLKNAESIIKKQVMSFVRLLSGKIILRYPDVDKSSLEKLVFMNFTIPVSEDFDYLFKYYNKTEKEFYDKNLKTADLIFNNNINERNQIIYLNNIIKKINEHQENYEDVFTISAKNRYNENDEEKHYSLNTIFSKFLQKLVIFTHLPIDETQELSDLAIHYYNLFQTDVVSALSQFMSGNQQMAFDKIEGEMSDRNLNRGSVTKEDKLIIRNSIDEMKLSLTNTINKYKKEAKNELKDCSSAMVDLIFKLLPEEYQDQKELLDVIIDTNINERLGSILEKESEKLSNNLNEKNTDIIENELYKEKRYKKLDEYKQDLNDLDNVYQDVIHEICIAYDIPEDDQNAKRVKIAIMSEEFNSPKSIFKKFSEQVKSENKRNLNFTIIDMHNSYNQNANSVSSDKNYGKK